MSGTGLIVLFFAVIALFGVIYFAVWFFCALQRNQREDVHSLEETLILYEGHDKLDEDFDEGQLIPDEVVSKNQPIMKEVDNEAQHNLEEDKKDKSKMNFEHLPAEILEKIFSLLPPQELKNVMQVCRWWREVGGLPRLWTWACLKVHAYCDLNLGQIYQEMVGSKRIHSVKRMRFRSSLVRRRRDEQVEALEVLLSSVARCPGLLESLDFGSLGDIYYSDGHINLSEVDPNVLAQVVSQLVEVSFSNTN